MSARVINTVVLFFYGDDDEKMVAEKVIENLRNCYSNSIITELQPFDVFYEAEELHQNYYEENPEALYCQTVISPKLAQYRENRAELTISQVFDGLMLVLLHII